MNSSTDMDSFFTPPEMTPDTPRSRQSRGSRKCQSSDNIEVHNELFNIEILNCKRDPEGCPDILNFKKLRVDKSTLMVPVQITIAVYEIRGYCE